jgi:hypothetical protein
MVYEKMAFEERGEQELMANGAYVGMPAHNRTVHVILQDWLQILLL